MIMCLRIRHPLAGRERGHTRPRLWAKGAQRRGGCLIRATTLAIQPCRKVLTRRRRVARRWWASASDTSSRVLAGIVSSAKPPTLSSHSVATATASLRRAARGLGHAGVLPRPARAFGDLKAWLDPRSQPIPPGIAGLGWHIGQDQPRLSVAVFPTGQQPCTAVAAGGS
jgi:hypothetical protein